MYLSKTKTKTKTDSERPRPRLSKQDQDLDQDYPSLGLGLALLITNVDVTAGVCPTVCHENRSLQRNPMNVDVPIVCFIRVQFGKTLASQTFEMMFEIIYFEVVRISRRNESQNMQDVDQEE